MIVDPAPVRFARELAADGTTCPPLRPDASRKCCVRACQHSVSAWPEARRGGAGEDAKLPRPRHDGLGGPMRRGQTLFWTITGSIVAAVAIVIALVLVNSGTPTKTASSPGPSASASAR